MQTGEIFNIANLVAGFLKGELSAEQQEYLTEWLGRSPRNQELLKELLDKENVLAELKFFNDLVCDKNEVLLKIPRFTAEVSETEELSQDENVEDKTPIKKLGTRTYILKTVWFRVAVAAILILGIGVYLWFSNPNEDKVVQNKELTPGKDSIIPGGNKALLTLADGTIISLDSADNGILAQQGSASIVKLDNGEIRYNRSGTGTALALINAMSTPVGGQYRLMLPDSSRVWLNAASSITYPAVFDGNERRVKITGEVYMEVAKNKARPFIVDIDGKSSVQVLGTSFNINAYTDENVIKTTLIEGNVRVSKELMAGLNTHHSGDNNKESVILRSGQQAILKLSVQALHDPDETIRVQSANIEQTLAWKNGLFNFNNSDLRSAMRQLERWYDIKVHYEGEVPDVPLKGEMYRNVSLSNVLDFLKESGVKFRVEGKRLIVL